MKKMSFVTKHRLRIGALILLSPALIYLAYIAFVVLFWCAVFGVLINAGKLYYMVHVG